MNNENLESLYDEEYLKKMDHDERIRLSQQLSSEQNSLLEQIASLRQRIEGLPSGLTLRSYLNRKERNDLKKELYEAKNKYRELIELDNKIGALSSGSVSNPSLKLNAQLLENSEMKEEEIKEPHNENIINPIEQHWSEKYKKEDFLKMSYCEQIAMLKAITNDRYKINKEIKRLKHEIGEISSLKISVIFNFRKKKKLESKLKDALLDSQLCTKYLNELWDYMNNGIGNIKKEENFHDKSNQSSVQPSMTISSKDKILPEKRIIVEDTEIEQTEIKKPEEEKYTGNIEQYFTEEYLSSLPLEQYIKLFQKFSGFMVTNAVRQGIREKKWHNHSEGLGEFHNDFVKILQSGKLHSRYTAAMENEGKNEVMLNFLKSDNVKIDLHEPREKILNNLKEYLQQSIDPGRYGETKAHFPDHLAVHFAVQEVADEMYGGEKNNQIFIAFPSLYIAKQCFTNMLPLDSSSKFESDLYVWTKNNSGMNINAGIVFIPANQQVDRNTGSKYQLNKDMQGVVNEQYVNTLMECFNSDKIYTLKVLSEKIHQLITLSMSTYLIISNYNFRNYNERNAFIQKELQSCQEQLIQNFGISDVNFMFALYNFPANEIKNDAHNCYGGDMEKAIKDWLLNNWILFKKSSDTVPSKEFWTDYFEKYPDCKPSKVVFYEEETSTKALLAWQKKNELNLGDSQYLKAHFYDISFLQNSISQFQTTVEKAINKYYDNNANQ